MSNFHHFDFFPFKLFTKLNSNAMTEQGKNKNGENLIQTQKIIGLNSFNKQK